MSSCWHRVFASSLEATSETRQIHFSSKISLEDEMAESEWNEIVNELWTLSETAWDLTCQVVDSAVADAIDVGCRLKGKP